MSRENGLYYPGLVKSVEPYALRVSAIGNPEGRGVGRLVWEKEYYGDILARMGQALWLREYRV